MACCYVCYYAYPYLMQMRWHDGSSLTYELFKPYSGFLVDSILYDLSRNNKLMLMQYKLMKTLEQVKRLLQSYNYNHTRQYYCTAMVYSELFSPFWINIPCSEIFEEWVYAICEPKTVTEREYEQLTINRKHFECDVRDIFVEKACVRLAYKNDTTDKNNVCHQISKVSQVNHLIKQYITSWLKQYYGYVFLTKANSFSSCYYLYRTGLMFQERNAWSTTEDHCNLTSVRLCYKSAYRVEKHCDFYQSVCEDKSGCILANQVNK